MRLKRSKFLKVERKKDKALLADRAFLRRARKKRILAIRYICMQHASASISAKYILGIFVFVDETSNKAHDMTYSKPLLI